MTFFNREKYFCERFYKGFYKQEKYCRTKKEIR